MYAWATPDLVFAMPARQALAYWRLGLAHEQTQAAILANEIGRLIAGMIGAAPPASPAPAPVAADTPDRAALYARYGGIIQKKVTPDGTL